MPVYEGMKKGLSWKEWARRMEAECERLENRVWETDRRYYALLEHLGLYENQIHAHTKIERKGGPERA